MEYYILLYRVTIVFINYLSTPMGKREDILQLLGEEGRLRPKQIAEKLGEKGNVIQQALGKMLLAGELVQPFYGSYELPEFQVSEPHVPKNGCPILDITDSGSGIGAPPGQYLKRIGSIISGRYPPSRRAPDLFWLLIGTDMMDDLLRPGTIVKFECVEKGLPTKSGVYLVRVGLNYLVCRYQPPIGKASLRLTFDNSNYEDLVFEKESSEDVQFIGRTR